MAAGAVSDIAGNASTTTVTANTVVYDTTGPIATVAWATGQTATTSSGPVEFAVTFDESVTGFTTGDITISGTAGATAGTITGSGNAYTVTVSAIPTDGTIVLTVAAGAVSDIAGNASTTTVTASTVVFQTVPGAPTAPNAVAGDATATVSWATPAVTGGRPIIGYRIEQSTNGGAHLDHRDRVDRQLCNDGCNLGARQWHRCPVPDRSNQHRRHQHSLGCDCHSHTGCGHTADRDTSRTRPHL